MASRLEETNRKEAPGPALCQIPGGASESQALYLSMSDAANTRRAGASVASQASAIPFVKRASVLSLQVPVRSSVSGWSLLASLLASPVKPNVHFSVGVSGFGHLLICIHRERLCPGGECKVT